MSVVEKINQHLAGREQLNESRDIKDLENFLIRYKKGTKTKEMANWIVQDFFRKADNDDVKEMMGWLEEEHPEIAKELKSRNLEQLNEDILDEAKYSQSDLIDTFTKVINDYGVKISPEIELKIKDFVKRQAEPFLAKIVIS